MRQRKKNQKSDEKSEEKRGRSSGKKVHAIEVEAWERQWQLLNCTSGQLGNEGLRRRWGIRHTSPEVTGSHLLREDAELRRYFLDSHSSACSFFKFFRNVKLKFCIVRSLFRSLFGLLLESVVMWIVKVRKPLGQQVLASSFVLVIWTGPLREVVYRDPYGFGKATRVGEAANPGPEFDDALSFDELLALEDLHVADELFIPEPDDLLTGIVDQAEESVHPRPLREVASEAPPPRRG